LSEKAETVTVPAVFGIGLLLPASNPSVHTPECGTSHTMILTAQAVPSAAFLPCIAALPSGWTAADPARRGRRGHRGRSAVAEPSLAPDSLDGAGCRPRPG
jgi:hypothetical protein